MSMFPEIRHLQLYTEPLRFWHCKVVLAKLPNPVSPTAEITAWLKTNTLDSYGREIQY